MAESSAGSLKDAVTTSPEAERLRGELRDFAQAAARATVTGVGRRLSRLAEGGAGPAAALAEGGKALSAGASPAKAVASAGAAHLKDSVRESVKKTFTHSLGSGLKDKAKDLLGKGGRSGRGSGRARSVTVVEDIDVGVPVREAYDQWTRFQEFSTFAKGVVRVEQTGDTTSNWTVKVAGSTRSWKANVTEQIPDERVRWTTEGAKGTVTGVVTFHPLTEDLTRVLLVLRYTPKGLFEKAGNLWRAQGRRARLDLKLYRAFVMTRDEPPEGWRGEIQDGEVVVDHEEAARDEEATAAAGHEDGEAGGPVEDDGYDEEYEDEVDDAEPDDAEGDFEGAPEDEPRDLDEGPQDAYEDGDERQPDAEPEAEPEPDAESGPEPDAEPQAGSESESGGRARSRRRRAVAGQGG